MASNDSPALVSSGNEEDQENVNWLECISAIETDRGLLYFCDASYGQASPDLQVISEFKSNFEEGTYLYSITAYNPFNRITNRVINELSNHELLKDINYFLPECKVFKNFSYFPSHLHHFERGYTIKIPPKYSKSNHETIVYNLAKKYKQAAFFKGIVVKNGSTIPYVVLVQGQYMEIKEQLVAIRRGTDHPAFLHRANHSVFKDISEVTNLLYQMKDEVDVCEKLYRVCQRFLTADTQKHSSRRHPVITVEGYQSREMAYRLSKLINAEFCCDMPECLRDLEDKTKFSTVLFSAFKTIADYIRSKDIEEKSKTRPVVTHQYWFNTAATLIASEASKGQCSLPPKSHDVYGWPKNLLEPDTVVLLKKKANSEHVKLKSAALRRMTDKNWVTLPHHGRHFIDIAPSLVVDKLQNRGIIQLRTIDKLCPACDSQSSHITAMDSNEDVQDTLNTELSDYSLSDTGKPFWW